MKRSEYEAAAEEWRAFLNAEAEKPKDEQAFPDDPAEWLSVMAHATCATPTCVNYGQTFHVELHENADGIYRVMCGQCGEAITPILDLEDDDA